MLKNHGRTYHSITEFVFHNYFSKARAEYLQTLSPLSDGDAHEQITICRQCMSRGRPSVNERERKLRRMCCRDETLKMKRCIALKSFNRHTRRACNVSAKSVLASLKPLDGLNHGRQPEIYVLAFGTYSPSTNEFENSHFTIYNLTFLTKSQ